MYGRDLGQKTFLENVYDDVMKTMFDECSVNVIACS